MHEETHNGNNANEAGSSHAKLWVGIGIAMVPILYVLSIGPVGLMVNEEIIPVSPFNTFYSPLLWLMVHSPLGEPLWWYLHLWGVT